MTRPRMLSTEQEAELRRLYPHTKTGILAQQMGLTSQSIRNYAYRLQLRKNDAKPRVKAGRKMLGAEVRMPIPDDAIKISTGFVFRQGNKLVHQAS